MQLSNGKAESTLTLRIDDVDRQILEILHRDARTPSTRIAQQIGVTDRTVRNHIEKLTRFGVCRIALLLDQEVVGYPVVAKMFLEIETGRVDEVAEKIVALNYSCFVASSTGDADLVVQVYATDNESLHEIIQQSIGQIDGVLRTRTNILPVIYKRPWAWFPDELRPSRDDDAITNPIEYQNVSRVADNSGK